MTLKKLSFTVTPEVQALRLDQALAQWLPAALGQPFSKSAVRKLIIAGAVYLNQKRVRIASKELLLRARVDVYVDLARVEPKKVDFSFSKKDILFEDAHLLIVNKPPGLPTQPTLDDARANLFAATKKFLAEREGVPESYLGLHHRLDRDTSGVLLFTKLKEANPGIAELFSTHKIEKTYQALVEWRGASQASWEVENYLGPIGKAAGKKKKWGAVRSGGDPARTDFKLLHRFSDAAWVEARPYTGRTHQIRVHLSEEGRPILGDLHYGGRNNYLNLNIPRVMLHAVCLTFKHPITHNIISVHSPLPEDFSQCLDALRKLRSNGGVGS